MTAGGEIETLLSGDPPLSKGRVGADRGLVSRFKRPLPPTIVIHPLYGNTRPGINLQSGTPLGGTHTHHGISDRCGRLGLVQGVNRMGREACLSKSGGGGIGDAGRALKNMACRGAGRGEPHPFQVEYFSGYGTVSI